MSRIKKNKYYIAFILSLCLVFAAIVTLQSYYNLKDIIQAPSENWGRNTSLGPTDLYKKNPSVIVNDQYAEVLTANKVNFTRMKIDRHTKDIEYETFDIKDVETYKVKQFEWDTNNIYFTESNNLYFVSKNPAGGYSAKVKIADGVIDFELMQIEEKPTIIAATTMGVAIYVENQGAFAQVGETYKIDKLDSISAVLDNKGIIHIATFAENNFEYPIYYLTFEQNQWSLRGTKVQKSLSASWGIDNIDIGIDDTDAYIFYPMVKWDQHGQSAKTYYTVIPLYSPAAELNFKDLYLFKGDENNSFAYLNEPYSIKTQNNELKLTAVRDTYDKKYTNGFSNYIVTMDQGQIKDVTRTTRNQRLITHSIYKNYKGEDILIYLNAAGSFNYEAFYTETGKDYIAAAGRPTAKDYSVALQETIPGYVSTLLLAIIKFSIYFPAILWFLMIEFFEIRSLKEKPRLSFTIGFLIYVAVKLISFGTYFTPLSISQMPPILTIKGAYYIYGIGIAVLSLLIEKILKKHNPEMSLILEYIIFAIIDIQITNMLFATYLV